MYVHIVSFKVKEGETTTFIEMQKFEEKYDAKPAGLDHFHIFKDRNMENVYHLIEYWVTKKDRDTLEKSEAHQHFHELQKYAIEKKYGVHECDVII